MATVGIKGLNNWQQTKWCWRVRRSISQWISIVISLSDIRRWTVKAPHCVELAWKLPFSTCRYLVLTVCERRRLNNATLVPDAIHTVITETRRWIHITTALAPLAAAAAIVFIIVLNHWPGFPELHHVTPGSWNIIYEDELEQFILETESAYCQPKSNEIKPTKTTMWLHKTVGIINNDRSSLHIHIMTCM